MTTASEPGLSALSMAERFNRGDYGTVALQGSPDEWQTFAALGLIGNAPRALAGLTRFDHPDARFYEAATRWIDGQEQPAIECLKRCDTAHARALLDLIHRPKIRVLSHCDRGSQWDLITAIQNDPRFEVINVGFSPKDKSNHANADIRRFYNADAPPDFYIAKMVEWHLLPTNLQELPCPIFGHTADYDLHIQTVRPWLEIFDELLTTDQTEWRDVSRLSSRPVAVFPKAFGVASSTPEIEPTGRALDVFISGTTLHPYHPDKARLLHQVLRKTTLRVQFLEGFLGLGPYFKILNNTRTAFTYIRHPGGMPTRGMEALAMGTAIAVQKESILRAYLSEEDGVVPYNSEGEDLAEVLAEVSRKWDVFGPRAARGASIIRSEFSATRIAGQYFRFLTFLAAKPRGPLVKAAPETLSQKRIVFTKGWAWHPAVTRAVRQHSARAWAEQFNTHPSTELLIDFARELILEHATAAYGPAAKTVQVSFAVRLTPDTGLLDRALDVLRLGMQRFPKSLVIRFNAIRAALYFGQPHQVSEALGWARETLANPSGEWRVTPGEDVFPWDFFSQMFNYRAYFDCCVESLQAKRDNSDELVRLLLASIAYHLSCYPDSDTEAPHARSSALQAVKWDPGFPFYRLHTARLLTQTHQAEDEEAAVDLLECLIQHSMLHLPAAEFLSELRKAGRAQDPKVEALLAKAAYARQCFHATVTGREDWTLLPLRPALSPASNRKEDVLPATSSRVVARQSSSTPPKRVLYLCLEFTQWQHARKLAYPAGLGLEEGFHAQDVECVTLPSLCGLSQEARTAWQQSIRKFCNGQRFDQVWFEMLHSEWDDEFLAWIETLATVRVGLIMESLRYEPEVYAQAPQLRTRHAHVAKRLRHTTHVLCIDEADAEEFRQQGQGALWWPQAVPSRFIGQIPGNTPDRRGVFIGSVYGSRSNWLDHPELAGYLTTTGQAPEDATSLPQWFDDTQRQWETLLLTQDQNSPCLNALPVYMEAWRRLRSDAFGRWIDGLRGCASVVNLPSFVRGYAGRVYEAMAAGRPAISWSIPDRPQSRSLFKEGQEILLFERNDHTSLAKALKQLQSDPGFARDLATQGMESVRRHHTVERRVGQVLHWIETREQPDFNSPTHAPTPPASWSPVKLQDPPPPLTAALAPLSKTLVRIRQSQADNAGATQLLDQVLTLSGNDAQLWMLRASVARGEGDFAAFRDAWEQAVQHGARDIELRRQFCDLCAQHGHPDLAARLSDRLFRESPDDLAITVDYLHHRRQSPSTHERTASTDWIVDRAWVEALMAQLESVADQDAAHTSALVTQRVIAVGSLAEAQSLIQSDRWQEAWDKTQEAILQRPFHPHAWMLLSAIALKLGDTPQAHRCAEHAVHLAPKWKEAKSHLAKIPKKSASQSSGSGVCELKPGLLKREARLTVCLITKNEERFLPQCLASVRDVADQIIVVDTGSSDRTVEIAKAAGAEVHHLAWRDDFSAARNAALEHARGDWILQIDADEELLPTTKGRLAATLKESAVIAYRLPLADVGKEAEGRHHVPRLFRNAPGIHYKGRIHEHAFGSLQAMQNEWGLENRIGKVEILHHGYVDQVVKDRSKVQRNLRLLERALQEEPEDVSLLMSHALDLVRSGQMDAGLEEYAKAFRSMSRRPIEGTPPELRERLLTLMCSHLVTAQRFQTVSEIAATPQATATGPTASLSLLFGIAQYVQTNHAEAIRHFKHCLMKRQQPALSPILPDILTGGPRHLMALACAKLGQTQEAERQFTASLAETPNAAHVRFDFARFLDDQKKSVPALEQLHAIITERPSELKVWRFGAEIALRDPSFLDFAIDWTSEAVKAFPRDQPLVSARAEALLLHGDFAGALPFWDQVRCDQDPRSQAAWWFCQFQCPSEPPRPDWQPGVEANVGHEFCNWFRSVISRGNECAIRQLAARLESLETVLPTAAERIRAALTEAQAA